MRQPGSYILLALQLHLGHGAIAAVQNSLITTVGVVATCTVWRFTTLQPVVP